MVEKRDDPRNEGAWVRRMARACKMRGRTGAESRRVRGLNCVVEYLRREAERKQQSQDQFGNGGDGVVSSWAAEIAKGDGELKVDQIDRYGLGLLLGTGLGEWCSKLWLRRRQRGDWPGLTRKMGKARE